MMFKIEKIKLILNVLNKKILNPKLMALNDWLCLTPIMFYSLNDNIYIP